MGNNSKSNSSINSSKYNNGPDKGKGKDKGKDKDKGPRRPSGWMEKCGALMVALIDDDASQVEALVVEYQQSEPMQQCLARLRARDAHRMAPPVPPV